MKNKKIGGALMLLGGIASLFCGFAITKYYKMFGYVVVGIGIFFVLLSLITLALSGKKAAAPAEIEEKEKPEYRRKRTVLTRAEYEFLQILKGIVNTEKYEIAVQVPLVAVIDKITLNSYRNELFRVVDFCILDNVSYAPLLFIELNDASHTRADRVERDRKVLEICESANMPLVTFTKQDTQDIPKLRKTILKAMLKK